MLRKSLFGLLVFALAAGIAPCDSPAPTPPRDGYALLDMYIAAFQQWASEGSGGRDVVVAKMNEIMAEAKRLRSDGGIDAVFYARFSRFLAVNKLFFVPDPENMLQPIIEPELARFVMDKLGEDYKPGAIGQVASALAESVLDLQIYLDTKDKRKKMMDDFVRKFPAPQKKDD